jgi:Tol biopolymer transport system component
MNADGSHQRRLTSTEAIDEVEPVWSPNGKEIAFTVDHPAKLRGIWIVDSQGTHRRRIAAGDANEPMWSPDGKQIGFSRSFGKPAFWIWVVPAAGGTARHLHSGFGSSDWSPDGRRIVFIDFCGGYTALFVAKLGTKGEGDAPLCILVPEHPVWSPDGREILYSGPPPSNIFAETPPHLYVLDLRRKDLRKIPNSSGAHDPTWQPRPH